MSIGIVKLITSGEYTAEKSAPEMIADLHSVAAPARIGTGMRLAAAFFLVCSLGVFLLGAAGEVVVALLGLAGAAFWFVVSVVLLARLGRRDYGRCAEAAGVLNAIPWAGQVRVRVSYRANQKPRQKWITNTNSTFNTLGIEGATAGGVGLHLVVRNTWSYKAIRRGSRRGTQYSVGDTLEVVLKPSSGVPDLMLVQANLARLQGPKFEVQAREGGIVLTMHSPQIGPKVVLTVLDALHQAAGFGPLADFAAVDALPEAGSASSGSPGLSKNASLGLVAGGVLFLCVGAITILGFGYSYYSAEQLGNEAIVSSDSSIWDQPGAFARQQDDRRRLRREQSDAEKRGARFGLCSCCTCPLSFGLLGAGMFFFMRQRRKNAAGTVA